MIDRRKFLAAGLALPALSTTARAAGKIWQPAELGEGAVQTAVLESLPGKVPLIKRAYRPPNYETPVDYFREPITRNDAFFVRYHLSSIPNVDVRAWNIKVRGDAARQGLTLDMAQLKKDFHPVEVVAVCQCSGFVFPGRMWTSPKLCSAPGARSWFVTHFTAPQS